MALPFTLAAQLRDCLDAQWEAEDEDRPASICLRVGAEVPLNFGTASDECCSGLAWVRVVSIEPLDAVGSAGSASVDNPCQQTGSEIVFELGVARCAPFGDASAGPTCAQWTALAFLVDQDARAMRRAVCCLTTDPNGTLDPDYGPVFEVRRGRWEPMEIAGACAGGTLQVRVQIDCTDC